MFSFSFGCSIFSGAEGNSSVAAAAPSTPKNIVTVQTDRHGHKKNKIEI
jgi:hypothetical protein